MQSSVKYDSFLHLQMRLQEDLNRDEQVQELLHLMPSSARAQVINISRSELWKVHVCRRPSVSVAKSDHIYCLLL